MAAEVVAETVATEGDPVATVAGAAGPETPTDAIVHDATGTEVER